MTENLSEQAIVLDDAGEINPSQGVTRLRLFTENGEPFVPGEAAGLPTPDSPIADTDYILVWDSGTEEWTVTTAPNYIRNQLSSIEGGGDGFVLTMNGDGGLQWTDPEDLLGA